MVRRHHKPLEQVVRRYNEQLRNETINSSDGLKYKNIVLNYEHNNGPLLKNTCGPQYLKLTYQNKISVNIRNSSDIYILTNSKEVVKIINNIAHCLLTKEPILIGYDF